MSNRQYYTSKEVIIQPLLSNRINDLTNKKVNDIYILGYAGQDNRKNSLWWCQCTCGNIFKAYGTKLQNNKILNCGDLKKHPKPNHGGYDDIHIGDRYGKGVVINTYVKKDTDGHWQHELLCDCGNKYFVRRKYLKNGKTKSCGCLIGHVLKNRKLDLTGKRSGFLEALYPYGKDKNGNILWKCKCHNCGKTCEVAAGRFNEGVKKSCGCLKESYGEEKIKQILEKNHIKFETQKTFDTCRFPDTNALARFDFYLPNYNMIIEYDGEQHFQEVSIFKQGLQYVQQHDAFKNNWCKNNKINIKRISYKEINNINNLNDLLYF